MQAIITLKNLSKHYGKECVLNAVSFEIFQGEVLVVLGASGAGKSTLLNILSGQDKEYEGVIEYSPLLFNDIDVSLPVVFQDFEQLLPWYSVKKNILLPYERNEFTKDDLEILSFIGLEEHLQKRPSQLSGGMKQRAAIARALLSDSEIIFMDEPFGSLDEERRAHLQKLISEINKCYNKTIFFITHDKEEAIKIATRIVVLNDEGQLELRK